MSKLYPPQIDGSLPAMMKTNNSLVLIVPFYMNSAVAKGDISSMSILIKTVATGAIKEDGNLRALSFTYDSSVGVQQAIFNLDPSKYATGQYYKVQIAFVNDADEPGYYSSVGIVKCVAEPTLSIADLEIGIVNNNKYTYTGIYNSLADPSEKVYSYCFTIKDSQNKIFDTSGELLHNTNNDVEKNQSVDTWTTAKMMKVNQTYTISYSVTTINGLKLTSSGYAVTSQPDGTIPVRGNFIATLYDEDAYINLHFKGSNLENVALPNGDYIITRASSLDNFESWSEFIHFHISKQVYNPHLCDDYSIEQGVEYKYSLQMVKPSGQLTQHKEAIYYLCEQDEENEKSTANLIVEFENAYLFDGERQLCIRYNPKIASFKSTLLESKVDTLGGKYPFIFRNGNVDYKEFSISGLVSALMDPYGKFLPAAARIDKCRLGTPANNEQINILTTSLSRDNFYKEREFKMEVLKWLTNGQPKLFRSPGEGNFIIRTMNASMTPNDTLSRMLHTFTCTAYEIADCSLVNLKKFNLINKLDLETTNTMLFQTFILQDNLNYNFGISGGAYYLSFENQYSDLIVELTFLNGTTSSYNVGNSTGKYIFDQLLDNPVLSMQYQSGHANQEAIITFGYYQPEESDTYHEIYNSTNSVMTQQFIGSKNFDNKNLITNIEDIRLSTGRFYLVKVNPKTVQFIQQNNGIWYYAIQQEDGTYVVSEQAIYLWDPTAIYQPINMTNRYYLGDPANANYVTKLNYNFVINNTTYSSLQPKQTDPNTSGRFESIVNIDKVTNLQIGNALICDVVYDLTTYEYSVEVEPLIQQYPLLSTAKNNWQNNPTAANYNKYISALRNALNSRKEVEQNDL